MKAIDRFLRYIGYNTTSDDGSGTTPSTETQRELAAVLCDELHAIGISDAAVDENAYVMGSIPATPGMENVPCVGFIAHMDTSPDFSGEKVRCQIIENYDGRAVPLGESGLVLDPQSMPHLTELCGRTLVTTRGVTLLGADDKAGIAEIVTAAERLISDGAPHGRIAICFTPDEEIGEGADHFDVALFGAAVAYTVDGSAEGELEYENTNAYGAHFDIQGVGIHPGDAKDKMINASLVACEIVSLLPGCETPSHTEGYEGYYHLTDMSGCVERASLDYIIRDHDAHGMEARLRTLRHIEKTMCERYGDGRVKLTLWEQYRNMREVIEKHMYTVDLAADAIRAAGLEPNVRAIRGGTDGARLSFMGLPCPNLGTGGYAFHGPFEHITVEGMDTAVEIILGIVRAYTTYKLPESEN